MKTNRTMIALALSLAVAANALAAEPTVTLPRAEVEQLLDAYRLIKMQYVDTVDEKKLITDAIAGMLAALDPHSQYLNKDDLLELEKSESGEFVGIGMEVEAERERMEVIGVTSGGPAHGAGIKPRDVIVSIDGAAVTGVRLHDVARRMRGLPGSVVKIGLSRAGEASLRTVEVTRARIHSNTVELRQLADGIAWIRLYEFGGATAADLSALLRKAAVPKGLILDLRNDPGGIVAAAIDVAAAFLAPESVVFTARSRNASVEGGRAGTHRTPAADSVVAPMPGWARTVPMVVLVNGESVSAAELLAGALQDHRRATVVGTPTFGKGSIQNVIALSDSSAIKLTVARYYTPSGREIQAQGIMPDVLVQPSKAATAKAPLLLREADLANHLQSTVPGVKAGRVAAENAALFGTRKDMALQAALRTLSIDAGPMAALVRRWRRALRQL